MKPPIHSILLLASFAIMLAPDGGLPAGGGGPGSTVPTPPPSDDNLDAGAKKPSEETDDTDYEARALELGIDLPAYPGTVAGIAAAKAELKRRVQEEEKRREDDLDAEATTDPDADKDPE